MCLGVNDIGLHWDRLSVIHITYFHNIHYSYSYSACTCIIVIHLSAYLSHVFKIPCMYCSDDESEMYYVWKT